MATMNLHTEASSPPKAVSLRPGRTATAMHPGAVQELSARSPRNSSRLQVRRAGSSTAVWAMVILLLAVLFTGYVGHVQATAATLARLQSAERENMRLHLKYNRLKGEFDRATGPAMIYERARMLGLEEGFNTGPTLYVE